MTKYKSPAIFLMIAAFAMQFAFAGWWAMLNNYATTIGATGGSISIIQSVREIPGLLAFTVVFWIVMIREQNFAVISLFLLGAGIMITALFPNLWWLGLTTLLNSFGFHYYETMNQSLALQWLEKEEAPVVMGKVVACGAVASLIAYAFVAISFGSGKFGTLFPSFKGMSFMTGFVICGFITICLTLFLHFFFPHFREPVKQRTKLQMHKKYWLYYAIALMQGSRRTIFTVYSGFMLVSIFKYEVAEVAFLFFINGLASLLFAPQIGKLIAKFGERWSLTLENVILTCVFIGYTLVAYEGSAKFAWLAGVLFCIDGISNIFYISAKTYFQKIGHPADMAVQASVAFSISHITSVFLPLVLAPLWLFFPPAVFVIGTVFSIVAIYLARLVPRNPKEGFETVFKESLFGKGV